MSYKFDSLIMILNKLDSKEQVTVHSLMNDLEMSQRTIYRYMQTLQIAGFPIIYDRKKESYSFSEGYSLRKPAVSLQETLALALSKKLLKNFGAGMEKSLSLIEEKLAVKKKDIPKHIVLSSQEMPAVVGMNLGILHQAITSFQRVELTYRSLYSDEETVQAIKDLSSKIEKLQDGKKNGVGDKANENVTEALKGITDEIFRKTDKKSTGTANMPVPDMQQQPLAPKRPSLKKQELSSMQDSGSKNGSQSGGITLVSANSGGNNLSAAVMPKPKKNSFLPAGTLVEGVMVTGALAPVKGADSTFKAPTVLIRLTRNGITANLKTFPLKNASVLASAEGIWNLERVTMETTKLVMVMNDGKTVEINIKGQIQSGDDGIDGVPGMIINPGETERMLKFLGGTTMSGIFAAMGQAQQEESTTAFGTTKRVKDDLIYELATGISKTWDNFSAWYLEQAKQAKPFIAVPPGKKVFILIQNGVSIDV